MDRAYVYIMSNKRYGTIYVGVTNDVVRRAWEHREGVLPGFTRRYGLKLLVWYEEHASVIDAIQREHNMKHWPRRWKTKLVDEMNPEWDDLFPTLV
jgi:putative endonuclease